ncbi:MAG: hypothetical protein HYT71_00575 [Candidatus Aenigmarchaeota archaeon]|nr:hypothetical protein [Candidatus Aenigmarchaeota archaeon]
MKIIWDMDGVMIPGRGTTHLANNYQMAPRYFMQRFLSECGQKENALYNVKRDELERGFGEWETNYNKGRIKTTGQLAACLTDLQNAMGVFSSSSETTYTKNALLEGMSMKQVAQTADNMPYNAGLELCVNGFTRRGFVQELFSNSNGSLVDAVAKKFGFHYSQGVTPYVTFEGRQESLYSLEHLGNAGVRLTGKMASWGKTDTVFKHLEARKTRYDEVVAIDDTQIDMLIELRARGARVFGFYNPNDPGMKTEHSERMKSLGIEVLTDLNRFLMAV